MASKNPLELLGKNVLIAANHVGEAIKLFVQSVQYALTPPLDLDNIMKQIVEIGIRSLSVISLSALFTGMVFAFQIGYVSTLWLGSPSFLGLGTTLAILKEMGPVISGLILSGRVGAQITAELGTMRVTEQIDALYTLGTNPVKYLYVPRMVACMISVPLLAIYADVIGTFGGFLIALQKFNIPPPVYWDEIVNMIKMDAVWHGLIKDVFFGLIIVIVSCYKGLTCRGGAEGVGKATTSAVVVSMLLILASDFLLTTFLMMIGIGTG